MQCGHLNGSKLSLHLPYHSQQRTGQRELSDLKHDVLQVKVWRVTADLQLPKKTGGCYCAGLVTAARCKPRTGICLHSTSTNTTHESQQLTNLMHKIFFYNKFIICLYMFRALCAYHLEVKIVLYSIWYHHTCRWPSGAQVERGLVTCARDGHLQA